jgi:hypothetical protein
MPLKVTSCVHPRARIMCTFGRMTYKVVFRMAAIALRVTLHAKQPARSTSIASVHGWCVSCEICTTVLYHEMKHDTDPIYGLRVPFTPSRTGEISVCGS